jgi:ElaB/YqjD/DUF883 family membrane-anchored ribosome-binding protein
MGEESARLREEIDRTRDELTRDVNRLADKTSPSRIVERRVERAKGRLSSLKEKVMGTPDTPSRTWGPTYTDDVYYAGSGYAAGYGTGSQETSGQSRVESAKESAAGAVGSAREGLSSAADSARDGLSTARDSVAHAGERASDAAHGAVTTVKEQAEGNPLAAGVVAFGIGWLVSSLLPPSDAEVHAALRAGDVAKEHGGPVLEQAKQAAQEVGDELKSHAQDAAAQVKETAQEAAAEVKGTAQEAVADVKDTAQEHAQSAKEETRTTVTSG